MTDFRSSFTASLLGNAHQPSSAWRSRASQTDTTKPSLVASEFVRPQDGCNQPDCELAAAKRWLNTWGEHDAPWKVTRLGEDLYCHQPFCHHAIDRGFQVLLVCQPDSHPLRYEWIADFERTGPVRTLKRIHWNGRQHLTERYR